MIFTVVDLGRSKDGVGSGSEVEGHRWRSVIDCNSKEVFSAARKITVPDDQPLRRFRVQDHLDVDQTSGLGLADVTTQLWREIVKTLHPAPRYLSY